MRLYDML